MYQTAIIYIAVLAFNSRLLLWVRYKLHCMLALSAFPSSPISYFCCCHTWINST